MPNNSVVNLTVMILFEIAMSTCIFWTYRRLDIRMLREAIWIVISHVSFILTGYSILGYLGPTFPGRFSLLEVMFIAAGIVLVCLIVGYWLDRYLSQRSDW